MSSAVVSRQATWLLRVRAGSVASVALHQLEGRGVALRVLADSLPMCNGTALLVGGGGCTLLAVQLYDTVRLAGIKSHGLCYVLTCHACLPACLGTEDVCGQPEQRWSGANSSFGHDSRASCQSAAAKDGSSAPGCVRDGVVGLVRRPLAPMR